MAERLRFGDPFRFGSTTSLVSSPGFLVGLFVTWMAGLAVVDSRDPQRIGAGAREYRQVLTATVMVFGGIGWLPVLLGVQLSRDYLMIVLTVGIVLLILSRWLWRVAIGRARHKHRNFTTRMVVVGDAHAVSQLSSALSRVPCSEYQVVGVCLSGNDSRTELEIPGGGSIPVLGNESTVVEAVIASGSEAVAVTGTKRLTGAGLTDLSWELERLGAELLATQAIAGVTGQRLHMRPVAALPLIHVEKPPYREAKRFRTRFF